eukprot:818987-Lingulodinium_polyedra.AAC.1
MTIEKFLVWCCQRHREIKQPLAELEMCGNTVDWQFGIGVFTYVDEEGKEVITQIQRLVDGK